MDRDIRYRDDEALEHVPLAPEDVQWLLEGKHSKAVRGKDELRHFLTRVLATAVELRRLRTGFDAEVRRRSELNASAVGVAGSLSPMEAAKFLSPEQLETLFDSYSRQRLAALEHQRKTAKSEAENWRRGRQGTLSALDDLARALSAATEGDEEVLRDRTVSALEDLRNIREWLAGLPDGTGDRPQEEAER